MSIDLKELIKAGVHFGHQRTKRNPKMEPYVWGHTNGVNLIDVSKTAYGLEKAARFIEDLAAQNKTILWIGTKRSAQGLLAESAKKLGMPYVNHHWVGGSITNFPQVKKSVTKLLHYRDILEKSDDYNYTKKELNLLAKYADKLEKSIGGIVKLNWPISAIIVIDAKREDTAIREAKKSGIPIVALVDTNSDPSSVDYVIPGNDDSPKSIAIILDFLTQAAQKGKDKAAADRSSAVLAKQKQKTVIESEELLAKVAQLEAEEDEADSKSKRKAKGQ